MSGSNIPLKQSHVVTVSGIVENSAVYSNVAPTYLPLQHPPSDNRNYSYRSCTAAITCNGWNGDNKKEYDGKFTAYCSSLQVPHEGECYCIKARFLPAKDSADFNMYYEAEHKVFVDTKLRLRTPNLGTNPIPEIDGANPSRITLPPPFTISKLENNGIQDSDTLKLTLAPPSESTSKKTLPKRTVSRNQMNNLFKHTYQQKHPLRITPGGKICLGDQIVQLTKPASHSQRTYPSTMPDNNLMFKAYSSSFPKHQLQVSSSRNLDIREDPSHSVPRFPGSGSNSVQGVPTPEPSTENLESLIEDQHHDIITLPSYGIRGFVQNVHKSHIPIRENMYKLAKFGRQELWELEALRNEILKWFAGLKTRLTQIADEKDSTSTVTSRDIKKALNRAQIKLTNSFLGYLITNHKDFRGKSNERLLREGWQYLKRYMIQWKNTNFEIISNLKHLEADSRVWNWTSDDMFAYLMWMDGNNTLSSKVLARFIAGWKELNGV
ncbi:uncharacterized protein MELLADRAFT_102515 [Melampsora larici-populina 98AG31]|uniref:Uncharacterized protein n=1 Tax=Melampsora larici-populina (strain 98AG31 / pathotype 3-4-7) TaxID=747676 RepID=F4R710_MELLP|nr:uncharacterized protein MELLADRAFT_102515 [Melampsora larici-populina 98AG31]EGG11495.1 hypothetical protein MELLADRAFT_102515 [Melampsora larici-populina 98AG31]